ncbi:MAG: KH domain-containing protein [Bacillota bacterium]
MKGLVETIAKAIVDQPDMVNVNEVEGEKSVILEISVADDDMGKIIGRQGRIARAIRTVVKAAATKEGKKVIVDIQES